MVTDTQPSCTLWFWARYKLLTYLLIQTHSHEYESHCCHHHTASMQCDLYSQYREPQKLEINRKIEASLHIITYQSSKRF